MRCELLSKTVNVPGASPSPHQAGRASRLGIPGSPCQPSVKALLMGSRVWGHQQSFVHRSFSKMPGILEAFSRLIPVIAPNGFRPKFRGSRRPIEPVPHLSVRHRPSGPGGGLRGPQLGLGGLQGLIWGVAAGVVLAALLSEIVTSLARGEVGLDLVAGLSISAALAFGETLAAGVVALMYAGGQLLEDYAANRARADMRALLARVPKTALRYDDGHLAEVAIDAIRPGDRLLIRQGDIVPVDGRIFAGKALLDLAALTGESVPVRSLEGQEVQSGARSLDTAFDLLAVKPASESTYAGIVRLVRQHRPPRRRWSGWRTAMRWPFSPSPWRWRAAPGRSSRRSHPHAGGAGFGNAVPAHPGRAGRHHLRHGQGGAARRADEGRRRARNHGAGHEPRHRQDRHADAGQGRNSCASCPWNICRRGDAAACRLPRAGLGPCHGGLDRGGGA
jgi:hypothetical protein